MKFGDIVESGYDDGFPKRGVFVKENGRFLEFIRPDGKHWLIRKPPALTSQLKVVGSVLNEKWTRELWRDEAKVKEQDLFPERWKPESSEQDKKDALWFASYLLDPSDPVPPPRTGPMFPLLKPPPPPETIEWPENDLIKESDTSTEKGEAK